MSKFTYLQPTSKEDKKLLMHLIRQEMKRVREQCEEEELRLAKIFEKVRKSDLDW